MSDSAIQGDLQNCDFPVDRSRANLPNLLDRWLLGFLRNRSTRLSLFFLLGISDELSPEGLFKALALVGLSPGVISLILVDSPRIRLTWASNCSSRLYESFALTSGSSRYHLHNSARVIWAAGSLSMNRSSVLAFRTSLNSCSAAFLDGPIRFRFLFPET